MEAPLVSFIITTFELPSRLLCECIDSILALSLRHAEREIIIVDDGSESSPMAELMKYGSDIIYIRQPHQGLSVARNTGIRMSTATYIQFVDGDDRLLQAPYEHCIDLLRFNTPEMVVFDFAGQTSEIVDYTDSELQSGSDYMRRHNIHGSACGYLFRRSILGDLCFTPGIWHEDEEFTPQLLLRAERVLVTDAGAYLYQRRQGSIITDNHIRQKIRRLDDAKGIIRRLSLLTDRLPVDDRTALQRRVAQLTMDYLYNVILQTGSRHYLERKMEELRRLGLFPLPDRDYTTKYVWFRRMTNSPMGISLLMRLIPIINTKQ